MILTHPTIGAMSIQLALDHDDRFAITVATHAEWVDAQDDFTQRVTAARTKGWA